MDGPAEVRVHVITDGNSLTSGDYMRRRNLTYPERLQQLLGSGYLVTNIGVSAQSTRQMIGDARSTVDAIVRTHTGATTHVVVAWEGTNEFSWHGSTAHAAFDLIQQYCVDRQASGYRVVVGTVLPFTRSGASLPDRVNGRPFDEAEFEARRQEYNALVRSNYRHFADALFDPASDPRIGESGDELDVTYYLRDRVHLNERGAAIIAQLVGEQVRRVAGLPGARPR